MNEEDRSGGGGFLVHNSRQKRAIQKYIKEVTGLELDQVPPQVQDRLAMQWIRKYAGQFRTAVETKGKKDKR